MRRDGEVFDFPLLLPLLPLGLLPAVRVVVDLEGIAQVDVAGALRVVLDVFLREGVCPLLGGDPRTGKKYKPRR